MLNRISFLGGRYFCNKRPASEAPDPGRHHVGTRGDIISECPGDFVGMRRGMRPDASENSQISPSTIVRAARAAGSHPHLASVLLQGRRSANIHASSGVIRGIADTGTPSLAASD